MENEICNVCRGTRSLLETIEGSKRSGMAVKSWSFQVARG